MSPMTGGPLPQARRAPPQQPSMMNSIYQPGAPGGAPQTGGPLPRAQPAQPPMVARQSFSGMTAGPTTQPPQAVAAGPTMQPQSQQPAAHGGAMAPQGQYAQAAPGGQGADVLKPLPTQYGGPQITQGPVVSRGQVNAMVGQAQANNAVQAANRSRANGQGMAARGFGGGSPALAAMNQQNEFARNFADQQAAVDIPAQYAIANANHQLATQQAGANVYGQRAQEELQRRRDAGGYETSFMNMIMGLAG